MITALVPPIKIVQSNLELKFAVVDIETLGQGPNALVFQAAIVAGIVALDGERPIKTHVAYWEVSADQPHGLFVADMNPIRTGLIDTDTLAFSFKHRTWEVCEDRELLVPARKKMRAVEILKELRSLSWGERYMIVAQNNEFDLGILRNKAEQESDAELQSLYNFRKTIDIRTLQNLGLIPMVTTGKTHCALQDALVEWDLVADCAVKLYKDHGIIMGANV